MAVYADLMAVVANGNRAAMHDSFGTHFSKGASPEEISVVANKMKKRCEVWLQNWGEMLSGIEPELKKVRAEKLDATAEKFVGYSPEELDALVAAVKAKQGKLN